MMAPTKASIDRALAHIDQMRQTLRADFERAMAKLDADERELLGLRPADSAEPLR